MQVVFQDGAKHLANLTELCLVDSCCLCPLESLSTGINEEIKGYSSSIRRLEVCTARY